MKIKRIFLLSLFVWVLLTACHKSQYFYEQLMSTPELYQDPQYAYHPSYNLGDTMVIYGRLNPQNHLVIRIGDTLAPIVHTGTVSIPSSGSIGIGGSNYLIDEVKVLITAGMGLGRSRMVAITSNGKTMQGPPIAIFSSAALGYPTSPLKMTAYSSFPIGATFLRCISGKGSVWYFYNSVFTCIHKGGINDTVLSSNALRDASGSFQIVTLYSGGVDAQEQNLYFSALTSDASADNATMSIYRLCRYNLVSGQLTTLNRTLLPKDGTKVTVAHYQPFEGAVGQVKIPKASVICPARNGDLYLRLGDYAICRISSAGSMKYLLKGQSPQATFPVDGNLMPGQIPQFPNDLTKSVIAPDDALVYLYSLSFDLNSRTIISGYDLVNQASVYSYVKATINDHSFIISGPMSTLTGTTGKADELLGLMPLSNDRLLVLYTFIPTWGVLDFAGNRGDQYAPDKFDYQGYAFTNKDLLLNYDQEGQLYMTANNGAVLVKTTSK
jgi:hypothetical protein